MRTLVVSDLHLGSGSGADLLRDPVRRAPLLEALEGADRLVVLGDGLELRDVPARAALPVAAPLFADVGRVLGARGEVVLVPGNHDHALIDGWLAARLGEAASALPGLEQRMAPHEASPLAAALAEHARPARVSVAAPGLWLRPGLYAMHGNYLDLHSTVPTVERLLAGGMARAVVAPPPERGATPDDYERVLAPLYAWVGAIAQRGDPTMVGRSARASVGAWRALAGPGDGSRARRAALRGGFAAAVAALNLAGMGPLHPRLDGPALRRGSLRGLAEVLRRLDVRAEHVLFGHSHRAGPWPDDDPAEWRTGSGTSIHNTGSWVHQPHFLAGAPGRSPYRPGAVVELEGDAPPRLRSLLGDVAPRDVRRAPGRPG